MKPIDILKEYKNKLQHLLDNFDHLCIMLEPGQTITDKRIELENNLKQYDLAISILTTAIY